eukprot:3938185-Rhodomonas_salina.5
MGRSSDRSLVPLAFQRLFARRSGHVAYWIREHTRSMLESSHVIIISVALVHIILWHVVVAIHGVHTPVLVRAHLLMRCFHGHHDATPVQRYEQFHRKIRCFA